MIPPFSLPFPVLPSQWNGGNQGLQKKNGVVEEGQGLLFWNVNAAWVPGENYVISLIFRGFLVTLPQRYYLDIKYHLLHEQEIS